MAALYGLMDLAKNQNDNSVEHIKSIQDQYSYKIPEPKVSFSGQFDDEYSLWRDNFTAHVEAISPRIDLFRIENCLVAPNAAIMTFSDAMIAESFYPYVRKEDVTAAFQPFVASNSAATNFHMLVRNLDKIDSPLLFCRDHGEEGYFHWLHSVLPRAAVYRELGLNFPLSVSITKDFQHESLNLMGYSPEKCLISSGNTYVCRELYFCSPMVVPDLKRSGGFFERTIYANQFLRHLTKNKITTGVVKPLYISRIDAKIRRLLNEQDLVVGLDKFGVNSVVLSSLGFSEQVDLFMNAPLVIGAHGAGLSNISFMREGSKIVEILAPDRLWPTYRGVAARSGLQYFPYVAKAAGESLPNDSDIELNIGHFLEFLQEVWAV